MTLTPIGTALPGVLSSLNLPDGELSLVVLGPGNGESLLLKLPHGKFVIVDSFLRPKSPGGICPVLDLLEAQGGDLCAAILTHPHDDHVAGFDRIVGRCTGPVGVVEKFLPDSQGRWDTVGLRRRGLAESALNALSSKWFAEQESLWSLQSGDKKSFGEVSFAVLHPNQRAIAEETDFNSLSCAILVEWESVRLVLGADLPTAMWEQVCSSFEVHRHQAMKVPHHASRDGFHPAVHGPGPRSRCWIATPYKRAPHPPRFEDGEGVALMLEQVDTLHMTSVLFHTPGEPGSPMSRLELHALAQKGSTPLNLPGLAAQGAPLLNPKDPDHAWVAATFKSDGTLSALVHGSASVQVREA